MDVARETLNWAYFTPHASYAMKSLYDERSKGVVVVVVTFSDVLIFGSF